MPITTPTSATKFNDPRPIIGQYKTDDDRIPYFNPADSGVTVLPGEPLQIEQGEAYYVYMAQGPIEPGETGYLVKRFTADFPCSLSATVEEGTEIWWDKGVATDANPVGLAKLKGNVTNGFRLGVASYAYNGHTAPTIGAGARVVCGVVASTHIRVVSLDGEGKGKGTLEAPTTTAAPTTTTTA